MNKSLSKSIQSKKFPYKKYFIEKPEYYFNNIINFNY